MKKFIFLAIISIAFSLALSGQVIQLASNVWPPFTNVANKKAISRDIVREGLSRSGFQSQSSIVDFGSVLTGLKNKSIDGSAALWYTEERSEYLIYSDPYMTNKLILVAKKGKDVGYKNLKELAGSKVAVVSDYAYGPSFDSAKGVDFVRGRSDQTNLNLLLTDSVDYVLVEALLVQYLKLHQQEKVSKLLEIGTNTIIERNLYFAIRKDFENSDSIISKFNKELIGMRQDGIYNKILELNWIQVDVDNDGKTEMVLIGDKAGKLPPQDAYSVFENGSSKTKVDQRYFIQGKHYGSWEDVPDVYKVAANTPQSDGNPSFKIKF